MNALVLKTGKIVNRVDKRGEHYLDNNFNPYTKDELEFFIKQNINNVKKHNTDNDDDDEEQEILGVEMNGHIMSFEEFNRIQIINTHIEKVLWLAATVIEQHPDLNPRQIADFCLTIYRIVYDALHSNMR